MKRNITRNLVKFFFVFLLVSAFTSSTFTFAEIVNPRQDWLRNSTMGLFMHWGQGTSPGYTSVSAWEAAVNAGGWDPNYWVDQCIKINGQYIILASFHSRVYYTKCWPSNIPGSPHTNRDFLGELLNAATAKGIKVILYITDDPSHHLDTGWEQLDYQGYAAYKGDSSIDIRNYNDFGMYSADVMWEVAQNYPGLAGLWIDNDNAYWWTCGIFDQIRALRPNWLFSNNNEDTPMFDYVSNEEKSGMTPNYDYAAATYSALPRISEACYKVGGGWWYNGTNPTIDYNLQTRRVISCFGSSIKALTSAGPMVNGKFPSNIEKYMDDYGIWIDKIQTGVTGTQGGGYMFGGLQPGYLNDGCFAVTTIDSANPDLHYIHVTTKPTSNNYITIRDVGYKVTRVSDLRTGSTFSFTQSGGYLTINGISSWDTYDTVFKVETAGRYYFYPQSSITASASATKSGYPASYLVDGDYAKYWDNNATLPVSITLDLGSAQKVSYLAVNQHEWSVSYARSATEDSARIKDYKVYVSSDGVNWGSAIKTAQMKSARGIQCIDITPTTTRYLKLEVTSTWAASTATNFYKKLLIDELFVVSDYVTSGTGGATPTPSITPTATKTPTPTATATPTPGAGAIFYQNTSYGGTATQVIPPGNYTLAQLQAYGFVDNWASSCKTGGYTVIMYDGDNFTGTSWTITSDTTSFISLSPSANDLVTSVKIQTSGGATPTATVTPTPSTTPTSSSGISSGHTYILTVKHSGKAVVVQSASTANSAAVIQYTYADNGVTNDEWTLTDLGTGYYKVINANSGKAMAVQSASTAAGALVIQYTFGTSQNDEWQFVNAGSGYYYIVNHKSGLYLDLPGSSTSNSVQFDQDASTGGDNQRFSLTYLR